MIFWRILMIFSRIFQGFWIFLPFSLHAFFDGLQFFEVILKVVDCFWWFFHLFLTIFKGFERFSVHFKGFLPCLMVFDVFANVFMIFYVFLMSFHVFYTIFDDCWRIFDGHCCFLRYFLCVLTGLASFWSI